MNPISGMGFNFSCIINFSPVCESSVGFFYVLFESSSSSSCNMIHWYKNWASDTLTDQTTGLVITASETVKEAKTGEKPSGTAKEKAENKKRQVRKTRGSGRKIGCWESWEKKDEICEQRGTCSSFIRRGMKAKRKESVRIWTIRSWELKETCCCVGWWKKQCV